MQVDISGYASSVFTSRVAGTAEAPPRVLPVESERQQAEPQSRSQFNPEVIERKVASRAESASSNLQRYREPDELPKRVQNALESYQSNARSASDDDSDLVGVDIFV
jgi:hypothetical protein